MLEAEEKETVKSGGEFREGRRGEGKSRRDGRGKGVTKTVGGWRRWRRRRLREMLVEGKLETSSMLGCLLEPSSS